MLRSDIVETPVAQNHVSRFRKRQAQNVVSGLSSILQQPDKRIDLTDILNHLITAKVRIRRISGRERRERVQVLERLAAICGPGGIPVAGVEYDLSVDSYARHSYRGC